MAKVERLSFLLHSIYVLVISLWRGRGTLWIEQ